jgi:uncharacterized protein (TIGR02594 family)
MIHSPPAWLIKALGEGRKGITEFYGRGFDNPEILKYWDYISDLEAIGNITDEIAWCAAGLGWCLEETGYRSTRRPDARSYEHYGDKCNPQLGSICVLWRDNPESWRGHVGFRVMWNQDLVWLYGANQTLFDGGPCNTWSLCPFPTNRVLCDRWVC